MNGVELKSDSEINLINGLESSGLLLLQGRPNGEPVVQYEPFVMKNDTEIQQVFRISKGHNLGVGPGLIIRQHIKVNVGDLQNM